MLMMNTVNISTVVVEMAALVDDDDDDTTHSVAMFVRGSQQHLVILPVETPSPKLS